MVVQGRGQCFLTLMLREEVLISGISVGFVRHGKTYVSVASMEGVCVDGARCAIQRCNFSQREKKLGNEMDWDH
jgi:hypothetical protein